MNSRVTNPESYIFSAIIYIGKDNFTSNEVAKILIERFSLPKNYLKAKAFAYNQIQGLVRKRLLNKVRKLGAYQYLYSATSEFNVVKENVELIEAPKKAPVNLFQVLRGARRIRKKSYAKVFRASVRAETSRLPVCGSAARRNRRLG